MTTRDPVELDELRTDAGTKPWPPKRPEPDPDEAYDRSREEEDGSDDGWSTRHYPSVEGEGE